MDTLSFAAINKNEEIRKESSSGAVFYALAAYVIENSGVVFGAQYNDSWQVVHSFVDSVDALHEFMGSKYVQSSMGDCYKKVKEFLDEKRMVLFSGCPCQIEGLNSFLGSHTEKLITVDFVCHGVPSPKVWNAYKDMIAENKEISSINFRDKTHGWMDFSLRMKFADGSTYLKTKNDDIYILGFLQNIYLRPSCYECRFKGVQRGSDITLADYWGVQESHPEMFDNKGTSLILVHSSDGLELWKHVSSQFRYCDLDTKIAVGKNRNALHSVERPKSRENYLASFDDFNRLKRMTLGTAPQQFMKKVKRVAKKMLRKS